MKSVCRQARFEEQIFAASCNYRRLDNPRLTRIGSGPVLKLSNIPLLAEEGRPRHQKDVAKLPLTERTGWSDRRQTCRLRQTDHYSGFALSRSRFAPVCTEYGF